MGENLMVLLKDNKKLLNMSTVDLTNEFNHYTMIMYYTNPKLKDTASLEFHFDCSYSVLTGKFEKKKYTKEEHTCSCFLDMQ